MEIRCTSAPASSPSNLAKQQLFLLAGAMSHCSWEQQLHPILLGEAPSPQQYSTKTDPLWDFTVDFGVCQTLKGPRPW